MLLTIKVLRYAITTPSSKFAPIMFGYMIFIFRLITLKQ